MKQRALNQKTVRDLSFKAFLDLARDLNCCGVEPRNDLGRPFFDGLSGDQARQMAQDRGLRILGLSEVYAFNVWSDERAAEIAGLIDIAASCGASTISLIPTVDGTPNRDLRDILRDICSLAAGSGVMPLVEPIGFASSSLPRKAPLVEAIEAVAGPSVIKLVHDTFQHVIAGETEIFPDHTALVHISGVSMVGPLDAAMDAHRILVDAADRTQTIAQIEQFKAAGYRGAFSLECTEPKLITTPDEAMIETSFTICGLD